MLTKKIPYSKEHIKKYALNYLNKFGTSKNYLIKFLVNKIKNRFIVNNNTTLQNEVEEIIEKLSKIGLLNDVAFCESRIKSLLKEGNSIFNITMKLKQKNINEESINSAFASIIENVTLNSEQSGIHELEEYALLKYAKKRNLLLWQQPTSDEDTNKQKAITSLMRKGFNFSIIENLTTKNNSLNNCRDSFENYIATTENKYNL